MCNFTHVVRQTFHIIRRFSGLVSKNFIRLHVLEIEQAAKLVSISPCVGNGIYKVEAVI